MAKRVLPKKSNSAFNENLPMADKQALETEQTSLEKALSQDASFAKEVLKTFYPQAIPMCIEGLGAGPEATDKGRDLYAIIKIVRDALMEEDTQTDIINKILADIISGAYQDRVIAYSNSCATNNSETTRAIQQMRQSADNHLLSVIQAFKNFKRPPVNVIVKQTEQVNIADKQINVTKKEDSPSDLDRKNEDIS
nr:hypothetical protein [Candidatus Omnitrophota bacterium]